MIDVFVDLSQTDITSADLSHLVRRWSHPEALGAIARRVTIAAPRGRSPEGLGAIGAPPVWIVGEGEPQAILNRCIGAAGRDGLPLLILLGPVLASRDTIAALMHSLERDPMFGFAAARVSCADRCCVARLSRHGIGETGWVAREAMADVPDEDIVVDFAGICTLAAPVVLANFEPPDGRFQSVAAALVRRMAIARRCGFRTVLNNRAMVCVEGASCSRPASLAQARVPPPDLTALLRAIPDLDTSWVRYRAASWERFEHLYTARSARSVLLDVRNVVPMFNGTTQAILGTLNGLKGRTGGWRVELLVDRRGAEFHRFSEVYDEWPQHTILPDSPFTAAIRLSQPWHIQEMIDLHCAALVNGYMMLDTIAWDLAHMAPHIDGAWTFLADHANGFLFDSDFTRDRFLMRFPAGRSKPGAVTYFSFAPGEYTVAPQPDSGAPFALVVGNNLDHKDVRRTVEALASGFPFLRLEVMGPTDVVSPYVTAYNSGNLSDADVQRLYANAQIVVYPSLYEGFGFPIITALAYGRTVLARRSTLLEEVAARCVPKGRLIMFDRREELVEIVGRLAHGRPVVEHPLGTALSSPDRPRKWNDVASETLSFLDVMVTQTLPRQWISRDRVVQQLLSFRH